MVGVVQAGYGARNTGMYQIILHVQEPQESILALRNGNKFPSVPSCSCTPHSLSYTDVHTHTHTHTHTYTGFPCLQSRANLRRWTQSSLSLIPLRIPRVILAASWVYIFHPQRCFHFGKKSLLHLSSHSQVESVSES